MGKLLDAVHQNAQELSELTRMNEFLSYGGKLSLTIQCYDKTETFSPGYYFPDHLRRFVTERIEQINKLIEDSVSG